RALRRAYARGLGRALRLLKRWRSRGAARDSSPAATRAPLRDGSHAPSAMHYPRTLDDPLSAATLRLVVRRGARELCPARAKDRSRTSTGTGRERATGTGGASRFHRIGARRSRMAIRWPDPHGYELHDRRSAVVDPRSGPSPDDTIGGSLAEHRARRRLVGGPRASAVARPSCSRRGAGIPSDVRALHRTRL